MIGRLLGLLAGAAIAALGYGLWKPVEFAKYVAPKYLDLAHVNFGPFAEYKTLLAFMTIALGVAVALAGVQRKVGSGKDKPRPAATMFAEAAPSQDPFTFDAASEHAPAADHHEPAHGHDDHGHGHDDHGHDAHAHDDHGHAPAHGHEHEHA